MSDALEHVRYSCGIAGEEVANYVDQLQAKIAELEAENAKLHEQVDLQVPKMAFTQLKEQLAAEQLNNKLLREDFCSAINHAIGLGLEAGDFLRCWNEGDWAGCREFEFNQEVTSQPADTFALDSFVAEKVKEYADEELVKLAIKESIG